MTEATGAAVGEPWRGWRTLLALALVAALMAATLRAAWLWPGLAMPLAAALTLGFGVPFGIVVMRHGVRRRRIRAIDLFWENFEPNRPDRGSPAANVSLEFVRGKYLSDVAPGQGGAPPRPAGGRDLDLVPAWPMQLAGDWDILFGAVPFILAAGFGAFLLFLPAAALEQQGEVTGWLRPTLLLFAGETSGWQPGTHTAALTVAAYAIAGSYLSSLMLFRRAVATFDLSALTFLAAFARLVVAVVLVLALWRAAGSVPAVETAQAGPELWPLIALSIGLFPDNWLTLAMDRLRLPLKRRYVEVEAHSPVVAPTIIDGIDYAVALRLEEANIHDVQNLATYNPIMLSIESPYGIYACFDWIAQAQLCCLVGPERFLLLRSVNVRTVLDLQRALLGGPSPEGGAGAAPAAEVRNGVIAVLQRDTTRDARMRDGLGLGPAARLSEEALQDAAVQHYAALLLDDLHAHRLRELWRLIYRRLQGSDDVAEKPAT